MGQFWPARSRAHDDEVEQLKGRSASKNKILREGKPSRHNKTTTTPTPSNFDNTSKMALPGHTVYDTADEDMRELHVQPAPRVRDEIKAMNLNHEWSYALAATTLTEQARREDTFYGDAHYYDLRKKKVSTLLRGDDHRLTARCRLSRQSMAHI